MRTVGQIQRDIETVIGEWRCRAALAQDTSPGGWRTGRANPQLKERLAALDRELASHGRRQG